MKIALAAFVTFLLVVVLPPVIFAKFDGDIRLAVTSWLLTLAIVAVLLVLCAGFVAMWDWAVA